jgi:hypothetical protein
MPYRYCDTYSYSGRCGAPVHDTGPACPRCDFADVNVRRRERGCPLMSRAEYAAWRLEQYGMPVEPVEVQNGPLSCEPGFSL